MTLKAQSFVINASMPLRNYKRVKDLFKINFFKSQLSYVSCARLAQFLPH